MRIVILGAGSTGEHLVGALRRGGSDAEIAIVEERLAGGECSYYACMPTKTLLRAPDALAAARRAPGASAGEVDPAPVFAWRDWMTNGWDDAGQVEWLRSQDARLVRGRAAVREPGVVEVGGEELRYDELVVATGSRPAVPDLPGLDEVDWWDNRGATRASEVPRTLVVLGGGAVGCELAQLFARLGSRVTLAQRADRLLPRVAPAAGDVLARALAEDGVDVRLGESLARVEPGAAYLAGGERLDCEQVLVAAGRVPNTDGLDSLGLTITRRGIAVDERCRAGDHVWAAGDVTGVAAFTHVGKYQARVVAANLLGGDVRADYRAIPASIFTDPQVASVGVPSGDGLVTARHDLTATPRFHTYEREDREGFLELVADPARGVLVGATAVGPEAGEWLQQVTLAIRAEIPLAVLRDTIQPYPTFSEAVFLALQELPAY